MKSRNLFESVLLAVLVVFIALMVFYPMGNGDFWAHAKTGEWIVQHRAIPRHNIFMYTTPTAPWINHSWLSAVAFHVLLKEFGVVGVQVFQFLMVLASWIILWLLWKRLNAPTWLGIIAFALAIGVSHYRFQPRPELFSAVGNALLFYWLFSFKHSGNRSLRWLPVVVVLWTNFHGGVAFGLVLLWLFVVAECMAFLWHRKKTESESTPSLTGPQLRQLTLIATITTAVTLINPFGLKYYSALSPSRMKLLSDNILEWFPFSKFIHDLDRSSVLIFCLFGLLYLSSFVVGRRKTSLTHLLLTGFTVFMTWEHMRNIWSAAQVFLALMAVHYMPSASLAGEECVSSPQPPGFRVPMRLATRVVAALVLLVTLLQSEYYQLLHSHWPGWGVDRESLPVGVVRFVKEAPLNGRMYNDMLDAGYLIWSLCPQRKLFVDVLNAYDESILRDGYAISRVESLAPTLNRWKVDYCIVSEQNYFGKLARWLAASPEWTLIYWDGVSLIYLRNDAQHQDLLRRYAYRYLDPTDPARQIEPAARKEYLTEVQRGLANPCQSAALYTEGGTMLTSAGLAGLAGLAERVFRVALQIQPYEARALLGLAQCQYLQGRLDEAIGTCRTLLLVSPNKAQVWKLIGMMSARQGKWVEAERALRRSLRLSPDDPQTAAALNAVMQKRQE